MNNYFDIEEFLVDPAMRTGEKAVPPHVINKILNFHLSILNPIREILGEPVWISEYSGYRPRSWEFTKGRSGNSQHTFGVGRKDVENWKGAVDVTASNFTRLCNLLINSDYTRVCIYKHDKFAHCDFKGDKRMLFYADETGEWNFNRMR